MPRFDLNLGTVIVSVPKLNKDATLPASIAGLIGSSTPRTVTEHTRAEESFDYLVTGGRLTATVERMAARMGALPVIMPEAAGYLADKIHAITTGGENVRVYMVGGA